MTRLMCSSERKEIEWVKQQLFRAGIRSQIRTNPVAQALRVARLELWVEDDCDFLKASTLYASVKAQTPEPAKAWDRAPVQDKPEQPILDVQGVTEGSSQAEKPAERLRPPKGRELSDAASLLEKEIEDLLTRERELEQKCEALEKKVNELSQALVQCQDQLACETATSAAAEKLVAELTGSRHALEAEISELRLRLRAREEAVLTAEAKAQALEQQLRGFAGSLGALYARLHAKNAADSGAQPPKNS